MLRYRPATVDDLAFVVRAHHEAMRDVVVATWGPWDEEVQDRLARAQFEKGNVEIIVADGEPIGYRIVRGHGDHVELKVIAIVPAYQGRGLGTQAVREIQRSVASEGKHVRLTVLRPNAGARALYLRLGFEDIDEDELYFSMAWHPPQNEPDGET